MIFLKNLLLAWVVLDMQMTTAIFSPILIVTLRCVQTLCVCLCLTEIAVQRALSDVASEGKMIKWFFWCYYGVRNIPPQSY